MKRFAKTVIGWEEWVAIPALGLPAIKVKVDTGAKSSALHAYNIRARTENGQNIVTFKIHPLQRNTKLAIQCTAPLVDEREVISSNGESETRYVIRVPLVFPDRCVETDITLTSRHKMAFRMLLGRDSLRDCKFIVDPAKAYVLGKVATPKKLYLSQGPQP